MPPRERPACHCHCLGRTSPPCQCSDACVRASTLHPGAAAACMQRGIGHGGDGCRRVQEPDIDFRQEVRLCMLTQHGRAPAHNKAGKRLERLQQRMQGTAAAQEGGGCLLAQSAPVHLCRNLDQGPLHAGAGLQVHACKDGAVRGAELQQRVRGLPLQAMAHARQCTSAG